MGVSDGVWECGKPKRFSIISMPQSEGEKGEVTFSLRRRSRRSFAPPFPPSRPQAIPAAADFLFGTFSFVSRQKKKVHKDNKKSGSTKPPLSLSY